MSSLPALTGDKDKSLESALSRMLAAHRTATSEGDDDPHVTAVHKIEAKIAEYAAFPDAFDPRLIRAYQARGISQPYTHQAEAIAHAIGGRNVVTVTPTASGKTLCYNAPVLNAILTDPSTRALYLFPTKALAQDQLAELHQLAQVLAAGDEKQVGADIGVFTYDGDTPQDARRAIRGKAHVVLSNPDMVHSGILPHHPRWAKLFENLKFIIIDELHAYRGVFGSHLANILRRLQRVCRHYGSHPTFICSSATIANPRDLAERLVGAPFELVEKSGAPRGDKFFLFVNPPVINPQLGIRRSYLSETRRVAMEFLKRGLQLIVFAQSRLATEILTTYLKDAFAGPPGSADVIRGYRGGYLPGRRREIERGLRDGDVRCVVSTSALELGIDIGALDVAVMAGYPGSIAATWQRAGRAGRRSGRSAAVLVASSAPIDQFVVRNPEYFFGASPEHALVNPDNLHILLDHVKCAAFELPFTTDEGFGVINVQEVLTVLAEEGFVHLTAGQWQWTHESYPADAVSLRSVTSDNFVVVDLTRGENVIGETDFTSGPSTLHEKAIYLVEGQLYQVERFDFDNRKAFVREVECDYYTTAITYTKVTVLETFDGVREEESGGAEVRSADCGGAGALAAAGIETDFADSAFSDCDTQHHALSTPHSASGAPHSASSTPHSASSTPHSAPSAPHSAPSTPHSASSSSHPAPSSPHSAPSTPHRAPSTPHSAPSTAHRAPSTPHSAPRTPHPALRTPHPVTSSHGEVHVVSRVVGFKKIKFYTNENVGSGELDLPEQEMHTTSYWMTIPSAIMTDLPYATDEKRDGVVGLAFAMRNIAPLLLMCDSHDLGLSIDGGALDTAGSARGGSPVGTFGSTPLALSADPMIFLYDNYPGGIGFSEPLFAMHAQLLTRTCELIDGCACTSGCPSCVGPEGATGPSAKAVALHLLRALTA